MRVVLHLVVRMAILTSSSHPLLRRMRLMPSLLALSGVCTLVTLLLRRSIGADKVRVESSTTARSLLAMHTSLPLQRLGCHLRQAMAVLTPTSATGSISQRLAILLPHL